MPIEAAERATDRAGLFARTLDERRRQFFDLKAKIAALEIEEAKLVREEIRSKPTQRLWANVGSPVSVLRRKREKLQKSLGELAQELPLLEEASAEAARETAAVELERYVQELRDIEASQPETWNTLKADYVALVRKYAQAKAAIVSEQRRLHQEALATVEGAGLRSEWENRAASQQVHELPASWESCLGQLRRSLSEDEPELARALRESAPAMWIGSEGAVHGS